MSWNKVIKVDLNGISESNKEYLLHLQMEAMSFLSKELLKTNIEIPRSKLMEVMRIWTSAIILVVEEKREFESFYEFAKACEEKEKEIEIKLKDGKGL